MAQVQLTDLEKCFGEKRILRRMNLSVPSGTYLVLLGESGCGKTTTLKMIAGLDRPDGGRITIGDRDMTGVPPRRRDVSMVFQGNSLYPHLTIQQSLRVGLRRVCSAQEIDRRIDEATQLVGISELLGRKPYGLSGGELRRAAVAKAIVRRCSVRLLDEPLSALDANVRHAIGESLLQWHADYPGTTIHVTHDGREAMRLADRIAVMDQGIVVQCASPQEIYNNPAHRNVALAIGSPPVQFVSANVNNGQPDFGCDSIRWSGQADFGVASQQSMSIGIRAQVCRVIEGDQQPQHPGVIIQGTVVRSSLLDGRRLIRVQAGPASVDAELQDHRPEIGDDLTVFVPADDLHFFDGASGDRLSI